MGQDREEKVLEGDSSTSTSSDEYITRTLEDLGAEYIGTTGQVINLPLRSIGRTNLKAASVVESVTNPVQTEPERYLKFSLTF
ncbi:hypothetical protein HYZ70_01105 [Candidatus Curtissbacteria bacterium]|nr:hypothetical protein [Candidatus Curtissbacteria bacterium]